MHLIARAVFTLMIALAIGLWGSNDIAAAQSPPATTIPGQPDLENPEILRADASDLEPGQVVRITGTGTSNLGFFLVQCSEGPTRLIDCDQGTGAFANRYDADGTWRVDMIVQRAIDTRSGTFDCVVEACEIAVFAADGSEVFESVLMTFDADEAAEERPTASVRPRKDLVDRQGVTAKIQGIGPFEAVRFRQCASTSLLAWTCTNAGSIQAEVDGDGEGELQVRRRVGYEFDETSPDCLETNCFLVAFRPGRDPKPIRLKFDANPPEPSSPTIKLSKRKGLVDGQTVKLTIELDGTENEFYYFGISQCALNESDEAFGTCTYLGEAFSEGADATETKISRKIVLRREIRSGHGENTTVVDCAESARRCAIIVNTDRGQTITSKGLVFDPSSPVARAKVTLPDADKLVAGLSYDLEVENYLGWVVEVRQCPRDATSHEDHRCRRLGAHYREQDRTIEPFIVPITPVRQVGAEELVDCYTEDACDFRVFGNEGPMQRILINFDSSQPSQEPQLTVKPSRRLIDGQQVKVRGINFGPESKLRISICDQARHRRCVSLGSFDPVKRNGTFGVDATMRRYAGTTDCATTTSNCLIRAWDQDGHEAVAPVRFQKLDPTSVALTVTPRRNLTDGQTVGVTATPDGPVSALRVRQCVALNPDLEPQNVNNRCAGAVNLRAEGDIYTGEITVVQQVRGVDCAEEVGRCEIQLLSAGIERTTKAIGFKDIPLPEPLKFGLKASPRNNLADGQLVELEISGSKSFYNVAQCAVIDGTFALGSCQNLEYIRSAPAEVQTLSVAVQRNLMPSGAETSWDCAAVAKSCVIALLSEEAATDPVRQVGLTFDPDAEPLVPTISVTPTDGLVDGQQVTVTGEGWLPRAGVFVLTCVGDDDTLLEIGIEGCSTDNLNSVQVEDDGTFSLTIAVSATVLDQDCRVSWCRVGAGDAQLRQTAGSTRLIFT